MPPRVLFIDDEETAHFAVREFLGTRGYLVDCAHDAAQALAHLARVAYDVVIADLRLGGDYDLTGLALIERVRRDRPETRVLVLSACSGEIGDEALRRGADRFLQKPQRLEDVAAVLLALREGAR